jgi:hypothetical protein
VTASIVLAPDDETRLARLTKMIDLARRFLDLDNYNGLAAVFAGLQSSPVHRLTRTLERLAPDARAALAAVTDVMRQDANYKRLRRRIRKAPGPCIPYLGIVVRDMVIMMEAHDTYIDEACVCRRVTPLFFFFFLAPRVFFLFTLPPMCHSIIYKNNNNYNTNNDKIKNQTLNPTENTNDAPRTNVPHPTTPKRSRGLINFEKACLMYAAMQDALRHQARLYPLQPAPEVQLRILTLGEVPEKALYEASLAVQPREKKGTPQRQ